MERKESRTCHVVLLLSGILGMKHFFLGTFFFGTKHFFGSFTRGPQTKPFFWSRKVGKLDLVRGEVFKRPWGATELPGSKSPYIGDGHSTFRNPYNKYISP